MMPFGRAALISILCVQLVACSGDSASASEGAGPGAAEWQAALDRLAALEAARDAQNADIDQLESALVDANADVAALQAALADANAAIAALQSAPEPASIAELDERIAATENTLTCASYDAVARDFILEGCNVPIRNGMGDTRTVSGLGNLIIGYNQSLGPKDRTGSYNLVIGDEHAYSSYGGLIAGFRNSVSSPWGSVTGGTDNSVAGVSGSVTGGRDNKVTASNTASISGGAGRTLTAVDGWAAGQIVSTSADDTLAVDAGVVRIRSNGVAELSAAGVTQINGALIQLNGSGSPAARVGDAINGIGTGPGGPVTGQIMTGSNTVLIGN
jgi:hypothetical protein